MAKAAKASSERKADTHIKDFIDMVAPSVIKFNIDHFICGNTFRLDGYRNATTRGANAQIVCSASSPL